MSGEAPDFGAWDWSAFGLGGPAPHEPSADARAAALPVRQLYEALLAQGFDHAATLYLVGQMLSGAALGNALGQAMRGESE